MLPKSMLKIPGIKTIQTHPFVMEGNIFSKLHVTCRAHIQLKGPGMRMNNVYIPS